jgi:hypothetical protein
VIYENLHVDIFRRLKEQVVSWTVLGVALIITYFVVNAFFVAGQPALGAVAIAIFNMLLPMITKFLVTSFEHHHTTDSIEDSFISKTVAARGFCSAAIVYMVGLAHSTQMLGPYWIGSVQAVLLADALTSPIIRLMDMSGNVNRYIFAPMAGTDARARALNQGTDYLLAER